MVSSGTYDFSLNNADVLIEAFDRCRIRPTSLVRDQILSARRSLQLSLLSFSNRGVNLWAIQAFTVQIVAGQPTYVTGNGVTNISANIVSVLEVYYSILNGGGTGINTDTILLPLSRTDYDQLPNKATQGTPSQYWYQKLMPGSQSLTLYQVPSVGYPTAVISGHALWRLQDAKPAGGQTPNMPYLGLDALCADLASRLATKYVNDAELRAELKLEAETAWQLFSETDREDVNITILPAVQAAWGRD